MKLNKFILSLLVLSFTFLLAQEKEVDNLLEKVNQAPTKKEKNELIEKLKKTLAKENKKAREEANAIIKAKQKIPQKLYKETPAK